MNQKQEQQYQQQQQQQQFEGLQQQLPLQSKQNGPSSIMKPQEKQMSQLEMNSQLGMEQSIRDQIKEDQQQRIGVELCADDLFPQFLEGIAMQRSSAYFTQIKSQISCIQEMQHTMFVNLKQNIETIQEDNFPKNIFEELKFRIQSIVNEKEEQILKLKLDIKQLKTQTASKNEYDNLESKFRILQQENQKIIDYQERSTILQREINRLVTKNDEDSITIKDQKKNMLNLKLCLEEKEKSFNYRLQQLQVQNDNLHLYIQSMSSIYSNTSDTQILETEIQQPKQQVRQLQKQNTELNKQLQHSYYEKQIFDLQLEIHKIKVDYEEEYNKLINPLQGQITQLQTQLSEKEQELQKIKQDFNRLKKNTAAEKQQKEQQERERNQRSKRADNIKRKMLESHGQLEVCFLVDCTGSMDHYKQQTMQSISGSMQNIKRETGRDVKWSTVCYQDYDEKKKLPGNLYQQLDFTNQPVQLEEYLNKVKCAGGGDFAEDVRGGIIQMCQKISWNKPFRLAILICDAPSHGKTTNGGCLDHHPYDDMKDSIEMLIKQDIMFIGLNFTKYTKTMYSYIEKIFKEHKREDLFMFVNMDGVKQEDIWKEMVKKISEASVSVTATNKKETKSKGQKPNEVEKTKDGAIEALCKAGNFYNFETYANVQCLDTKFKIYRVDIKEESFNKKIEDIHLIKVPEDYEVHQEGIWESIRTLKPFAFGMMKEVYLMKKKNATNELYVIKTPLGGKTYGTLNAAITECRSHLVCQKLMKKFTKEVNDACDEAEHKGQKLPRYPQIVYSDFLILEEAPDSFWIAERLFKGEFIKYNNNNGYISSEQDQLNQMAQAFTYYTYHISNFNYMVNDIQGVEKYFTDPAINTGKGDFDETDMGEDGQAMFMVNFTVKKQVCRDILKLLNIYPED